MSAEIPYIYRYRIIDEQAGSIVYGNCAVCGKPVSSVFAQIEERQFVYESEFHWTYDSCFSYFGHKECLESKRRGTYTVTES